MKLKSFATLAVMTALTVGFASGCGSKSDQAAEHAATAAAQNWLKEIDGGQYAQSWQDASAFFQGKVPEQTWVSEITPVRRPLGELVSRNLDSAQYATQLPGAPEGQYVVMRFDTSFANKQSAVETVTFSLEQDGQWKASGYYIK
jgi:opacity protein-like surface antigen